MNNSTINKWLDDLAGYFERRDTHGEDKAFWANVYNAESVRKIKAALSAAEARIRELEGALRSIKIITDGPTPHSPYLIASSVNSIARAELEGETK